MTTFVPSDLLLRVTRDPAWPVCVSKVLTNSHFLSFPFNVLRRFDVRKRISNTITRQHEFRPELFCPLNFNNKLDRRNNPEIAVCHEAFIYSVYKVVKC